jgi:chemotaxis protein CheX
VRVEFVNPFVQAACEVVESELAGDTEKGQIRLQKSAVTTQEVTAVVGVSGRVAGVVLYSMSEATARAIVSRQMGREFAEFDSLAQSGIGELGNVISGRAGALLAAAGYPSHITPPALLIGQGALVTTMDLNRLVCPLQTELGPLEIQVVLRET